MNIVLVITTYAKNYASTNCQSLDSADPKLPLCPPPQQKSNPTRHEPGTVVTRLLNWTTGPFLCKVALTLTESQNLSVCLQCNYSNWDTWKKIVQSQRFLKTKDSQVIFFGERTNKIQNTIMQPLKTLKSFQLTWPLRKQLSNLWMLLVRFPEIVVIGQSFSSAPVRAQVAEARNMSIGEHGHCCVTFKI